MINICNKISLMISHGLKLGAVNGRKTINTMTKRKSTKGQTMTYKTLHNKIKAMFFPKKASTICKLSFRKLYATLNNIQYDYLYCKSFFPFLKPD